MYLISRAETWDTLWGNLVDKLLQLVRVAAGCRKLVCIAEGDVLETMYLTKAPEDVVFVLAQSLDLEDLRQIGLLADTLHKVIEELGLGKRILPVHRKMVQKLVFCRAHLPILEQTEASHQVVLTLVSVSVDANVAARSLCKEACRQLQSHPVGTEEDSTDHGVAHPLLAKQRIRRFHFTLDRHPFVGSKGSHRQGKH